MAILLLWVDNRFFGRHSPKCRPIWMKFGRNLLLRGIHWPTSVHGQLQAKRKWLRFIRNTWSTPWLQLCTTNLHNLGDKQWWSLQTHDETSRDTYLHVSVLAQSRRIHVLSWLESRSSMSRLGSVAWLSWCVLAQFVLRSWHIRFKHYSLVKFAVTSW